MSLDLLGPPRLGRPPLASARLEMEEVQAI